MPPITPGRGLRLLLLLLLLLGVYLGGTTRVALIAGEQIAHLDAHATRTHEFT